MTDLDKLIEAVEGGTTIHVHTGLHVIRGIENRASLLDAYYGSLDAAKALHEALLPDDYWINWFDLDGIVQIKNSKDDVFDGKSVPNPARAWLISILKARRSLST